MSKKLDFEDFLQPVLKDKPVKMALFTTNGKEPVDSGQWLKALSFKCKKLRVAVNEWGVALRAIDAQFEGKEPTTAMYFEKRDLALEVNTTICLELVKGWSFSKKFSKTALKELLRDNHDLAQSIVDYCLDVGNFTEKK